MLLRLRRIWRPSPRGRRVSAGERQDSLPRQSGSLPVLCTDGDSRGGICFQIHGNLFQVNMRACDAAALSLLVFPTHRVHTLQVAPPLLPINPPNTLATCFCE